jgi:anaerobic magnesium-protoporphyrin IX monomethyl ester cyclase
MKVAIIFPPQWDPRQPPLSIPTLAGVLKSAGHKVQAWDLNLYLYWQILLSRLGNGKNADIFKQYLSPDSLRDHNKFSRLSSALEKIIYFGYDETGNHKLYWDHMGGEYSPNVSDHWAAAIKKRNKFPFFRKISLPLNEIISWKPDLACISCISDTQVIASLSIASKIRSKLPHVRILLGGPAIAHRRSLLGKLDWLFGTVDAFCVSYGEPSLIALAEERGLKQTPGIIWHDGSNIQGSDTMSLDNFDWICLPDFSVLPLEYYLTPIIVMPIETAKGCPWGKCAFCGHPHMEVNTRKAYKPRPIMSLVREIRNHVSMGYTRVSFVDDAIPYDRFEELSLALLGISDALSWTCYLRLEEAHNIDTFLVARKSGCRKVFFGLETGSKRLMKLYKKGSSPEIAKRVLRDASKADLAIHLFLITGFPDESEADREATDQFLRDVLPSMNARGFSFDVFPLSAELETPLYLNPHLFGSPGIKKDNKKDLAYRFDPIPSNKSKNISNSRSGSRIKSIIKESLKGKDGLYKIELSHDSMHLLLIEAQFPSSSKITGSKSMN